MISQNKKKITIIGGGLAGCFLSILLAKRGYTVDLYEKLSEEAISDTNSKRSYNITFRDYGIDMLKKADVWNDLKPYLLPLKGASTQLSKNTKPILSLLPEDSKRLEYLSISRSDLLKILLKHMTSYKLISVHFNTTLLSINKYEKTIVLQNNETKKISVINTDVVVGADGTNSSIRVFLQQGQHTHHSQEYSPGGYKQFTITKEEVQILQLRADIAYTWVADEKFILAFPNLDGSLASLLIYPKDKKPLSTLTSINSIKKLIEKDFPLFESIYQNIAEQLIVNPEGSFVTIHTDPWSYKDFITLVGDAAHGFYPFFGQGTSAAFGDCIELVDTIDEYAPAWEKVLSLYQQKRQKHMDALGELSKEGLIRYTRNKRGDYDAIYDKLESIGNHLFPQYIQPPIFESVMNDPGHTADFVKKHTRQRSIAKKAGISLLVRLLTKVIGAAEKI